MVLATPVYLCQYYWSRRAKVFSCLRAAPICFCLDICRPGVWVFHVETHVCVNTVCVCVSAQCHMLVVALAGALFCVLLSLMCWQGLLSRVRAPQGQPDWRRSPLHHLCLGAGLQCMCRYVRLCTCLL